MEKRKIRTQFNFSKLDFKVTDAKVHYISGRISGIKTAICEDIEDIKDHGYAIKMIQNDGIVESIIFTTVTTEDRYAKFKEIIEALYPGACEFDWKQN